MQQRLPLTLPAEKIARLAIHLQLPHVPADRSPALDLSCIFVPKPPAPVIAAVPLKPAARVFAVYPALAAPHRERLAGATPKKFSLASERSGASFALANQLAGNSPLQSVRYFPPKTPRRSISGGVSSGGSPGQNGGQRVQRERTDNPAASGHSRRRFAASPRCPSFGCHGSDGSHSPHHYARIFQTCRILTNRSHVVELSNDGDRYRECPSNSDPPALANLVVVQ